MKRLIPILFALALTLQTRAAESAKEAIERLNKIFAEAHIKGDAKTIASQYSKDAQCLWEDEPIFSGRENIEAAWKKLIGDGGRKADVKPSKSRKPATGLMKSAPSSSRKKMK